jgi:hypothetical protein
VGGTGWPAALLTLAVATMLGALAWLLWPAATPPTVSAPATVLESAPCGGRAGGDVVSVEVHGRVVRAELDGCGHRPGVQLTVEVPVGDAAALHDGMTVALAGTGTPPAAATAQRIAAVLLALAGAAGAVLGWRARPRPAAPHGDVSGQSRAR